MKIIFAPSKEMDLSRGEKTSTSFSKNTEKIISSLKTLDDTELKKLYKVSDKVLEEIKAYIENFDKDLSFKALNMYKGLAYKYLNKEDLKEEAINYLNDHLLILSAFYGPISPETYIKPYRLDFNTPIKVNGKTLKNLWKDDYNKNFKEGEIILNLASNEFSSLIDRKKFIFYDFEFYEDKDGILKSHSTTSKKARGLMVRYLASERIEDIEAIKSFNIDSYKYREDLSEEFKFVFVK
ncbi:peroxide stress protein YaaA [Neofamilia massiliensis]|uniref:peroxide stress protein YaaA n=1 Tax=Neofamilia massiliensis TaxID=1673724 RepID=UPI0006BB66EE|nr:peroxide stress protein YaaA [Neofamilia massiliensis]